MPPLAEMTLRGPRSADDIAAREVEVDAIADVTELLGAGVVGARCSCRGSGSRVAPM